MAALTPATSADEARTGDLRRLARGSSLNLAGSFVAAVLNLVLPVIITRGLSPDEAGTFFLVTVLFTILINVGTIGADTGVLRLLPRAKALDNTAEIPGYLRTALTLPVLFSVAVSLVVLVFADPLADLITGDSVTQQDIFRKSLITLAPALPIAVAYIVCISASRGLSSVKPLVYVEKIGRTGAQTALVGLVQVLAPSVLLVVVAWVVPYLAALLVIALWLVRTVRRTLSSGARPGGESRPRRILAREFWAFAGPRALSRVFSVALQRLDILIVGALRGPAEAAIYTAASRFLVMGLMFVQAIQQVMAPRISEFLAKDDVARARVMYQTATAWLTMISWPLYLFSAAFAPLLLSIFGPGFDQGASVVVILCLAMLVATICGPVDTVLLMGGRSSLSLMNTGAALAVNIALDLLLVPRYGLEGAAVAWTAGILVNNLVPLWQVHHFLDMHPFGSATVRAAGIALSCFGGLTVVGRTLFGTSLAGLLVTGTLTSLGYLSLLIWQRRSLELDALQAVFRRR